MDVYNYGNDSGDDSDCIDCRSIMACIIPLCYCLCCIGTIVGICMAIWYCPDNVREGLNKQSGYLNEHLSRILIVPRDSYGDTLIK